MFRFLAKTFCGSFVLLMTLLWSTSGQAECMQCSAPQGDVEGNCYFSDGNGFINCSRNSCSGNCKKQPYVCPEWPCWLSETINPGDEKSGPLKGCGGIGSGTTLTSTRTAGEIFQVAGGDEVLAQAILHLEWAARQGLFGETGAFGFALAQNAAEMQGVLAGKRLAPKASRAATSGFADYTAEAKPDGSMDISLRVWKFAYPSDQPIGGLSAFLRYEIQAQSLTLVTQNTLYQMPTIKPEYLYKSKAPRQHGLSGRIFE